jgi:hypothetical protein
MYSLMINFTRHEPTFEVMQRAHTPDVARRERDGVATFVPKSESRATKEAAMSDTKTPRTSPILEMTEDDVFVTTHFERDNRNVDLYLKIDRNDDSPDVEILSWTDDAVDQAVEDGFLSAKDWKGSAFEYGRMIGKIQEIESESNVRLRKIWDTVIDAAATFQAADIDTEAADFLNTLPEEIRDEIAKLPVGWKAALEDATDTELSQTVGWQILGPDGYNIHAEEDDPFGMTSFSILVGEAVETARKWAAENPGYTVAKVKLGDIEEPEYLDRIRLVEPAAPGM